MLEQEGPMHSIDRDMAYSIQREWLKNLEVLQSEPVVNTADLAELQERDESFEDSHSDLLSEEDRLDRLERQIGVYMVCFFTKVTKTKTKWKCSFKNGFINLDNYDIPYSTATGEFLQW
ncbi:uncharacterized protein VICG_01295 [Vittaforma corneae ATCC 50505]|uniref:Uncharacterized protein n=1 Tax=Vittaforma corneae (strain ATCC 50505) TaxID=993615 RepID=L2GMY5_VITCO|nr:uncharacterized protein VICG_01295 [Vittaforma corneae ATCC 50505]ELA41662.1 hypothetical protein VICG_01295 [Vittaforma corneae ATCC 50505]